MSLLSRMLEELKKPDDQGDDWYAWCTNQLSHSFLGVVCALHFGLLVAIALACLKEIGDLLKHPMNVADSMTDVAFWTLGAWLIVAEDKIVVSILIIFALICGVIPRLRRLKRGA